MYTSIHYSRFVSIQPEIFNVKAWNDCLKQSFPFCLYFWCETPLFLRVTVNVLLQYFIFSYRNIESFPLYAYPFILCNR